MFKPDILRIRRVLNLQKRGDGKLCGKIRNCIEHGSPFSVLFYDTVSAINTGKVTDYPGPCHFCTLTFPLKGYIPIRGTVGFLRKQSESH